MSINTTTFPVTGIYQPALIIPFAVMRSSLSLRAKLVWAQIKAHLNRKTGQCNPRYKLIADELGLGVRTVCRAVRELRLAGLLVPAKHVRASSYVLREPGAVEETGFRHANLASLDTPKMRSKTRQFDASIEPIELNLSKGTAADAAGVFTPPGAAAAASVSVEMKPETPAPAGSPGEPATFGHIAETEKANFPKNFPGDFLSRGAELAVALMTDHPEPGNLPKAISEVEKLVSSAPGEAAATIEALRASHASWRLRWAEYAPGRFIPQLWRWIHDGDWLQVPVERKGVKSETWIERRAREEKESNEESYRTYAENGMWEALRAYMGPEDVEVWRARIEAETAA